MKTLKTFQAEISWLCVPWDSVTVEKQTGRDGQFRLITGIPAAQWYRGTTTDLTINPANSEPGFWRQVRQWGFAFEDDAVEKVGGYYQTYGLLKCVPKFLEKEVPGIRWDFNEELWEANKMAMGWFNLLTSMMEWLKEGRLGPLRDLFGNPRMYLDCSDVWFYPKGYDEIGIPFFGIRWITPPVHVQKNPLLFKWLAPLNDDHVLQATWDVIVGEVDKMLNEIQLTPAQVGEHNNRNLTWRFYARGAFEAAFLQWYFQEMADYSPEGERRKCQNPECDNYLPLKRNPGSEQKFCSNGGKCRKRAYYLRGKD